MSNQPYSSSRRWKKKLKSSLLVIGIIIKLAEFLIWLHVHFRSS